MNELDLTLPTPAENLACEEALLDAAEANDGPSLLRFWESTQPFVVVGYANKVAEEVNIEACRAMGIPILRRCSGGGTVVQGPGCLNYAVILKIEETGPLATITETNRWIMERTRAALTGALGQPVSVEGHTDLAIDGRKFSGNAQRRKRNWLLFHGTFLIDFDLELIQRLLLVPPRQPDYRHQRSHSEFITQLKLPRAVIKSALRDAWNSSSPLGVVPEDVIQQLVVAKYSRDHWNFSR